MIGHLSAGDLQAYLQGSGNASKIERHLSRCARCRQSRRRIAATGSHVDFRLSVLASPSDDAQINVRRALADVLSRQPVAPEAPWYRPLLGTSRYVSVGIHVAVVTLLMFGATNPKVRQSIRTQFDLIDPTLTPYAPVRPAQGGGGGGAKEPLPVTAGKLPKPAPKQFVPPMIVDHTPKLAMEPSIVAPPDTVVPQSAINNWGDPLAKLIDNSNGSGLNGGMGNGNRGGVGPGNGIGYGPGDGGYFGEGVFTAGGAVSAPVPIFRPDPEYSDEARKARYSGTVIVAVIVDTQGHARNPRVLRGVGMGLDEKAIEAVQKWKFKPGMKDGHAVNVRAQIEVNFRLL